MMYNSEQLANQYAKRPIHLTKEQEEFIANKLGKKSWRLDNLYTILDKNAIKRKMRLNYSQKQVLFKYKHNRKIILKSRQLGISTLFLAYNLDSCLFKPGFQAGIQSYGQKEAEKLSMRAHMMWDELDPAIKELMGLKLVVDNTQMMMWNNGSVLRIGNFRGDTLQSLHVSELAKIAKEYPKKARELKTGAFQAVGKNNIITIESTAEGKSGLFYEMWQKAWANRHNKLTHLDFQAIFLSWIDDPDCTLDVSVDIPSKLEDYFQELEIDHGIVLKDTQKWWYAKKYEELGDDIKQEYPSFPDEAFESTQSGSYFAEDYRKYIVKRRRLVTNLYDKNLPTYVAIDLGMSDLTVMVFYQVWSDGLRIIDEYHSAGESIKHYVNILRSKPYNYKMVYLPHDAQVRELGTGLTRFQMFRKYGVRCQIIKRQSIEDGITLIKEWIPHIWIDNSLENIKKAFVNYSRDYNEALGIYSSKPKHDIWSHFMDAIRYMCTSLGDPKRYINKERKSSIIQRYDGFAL